VSAVRPALRRKRLRRGQAGAAFAEALIIIPLFTVLFGATIYLGIAYDTKMSTMRSSKGAVWGQASPGCEGAPDTTPNTTVTAGPMESSLGSLEGTLSTPKQYATLPSLSRHLETPVQTKKSQAQRTSDGVLGQRALNLKTSGVTACNVIPRDVPKSDEKSLVDQYYQRFIGQ
jgi:hypothetical protein